MKCFKLVWLGDSNNILTAGFTKQSKREFRIFDTRDLRSVGFWVLVARRSFLRLLAAFTALFVSYHSPRPPRPPPRSSLLSAPLFTQEIDQASGVLMPFYDPDLKILYLGGKGDGNIRYYELSDSAPFSYPLSEHRTAVSAKGLAMLPKRACNPLKVRLFALPPLVLAQARCLGGSVCLSRH